MNGITRICCHFALLSSGVLNFDCGRHSGYLLTAALPDIVIVLPEVRILRERKRWRMKADYISRKKVTVYIFVSSHYFARVKKGNVRF